MQRRKGLIYPRIVEEVVNIDELRKVWDCGYMTVNRIMHGHKAPNHLQKEQLSEYLGIPVEELFVRIDEEGNIIRPQGSESQMRTPLEENSEIIQEFAEG